MPSARGCTYLLPRSHYAVGLLAGQGFSDEATMATARKFLGVTYAEIDALGDAICKALVDGPLDPKEMRPRLGDTVRTFGDEGKKRGITTTIPIALGFLQSHGRIRRIPANGRLDGQRYVYELWPDSPLASSTSDRETARVELARLFFNWIGPATFDHFRWFSGLGVGDSKQALADLQLEAIGEGSPLLIPKDRRAEFDAFETPSEPQISLVSPVDGIVMLRRDAQALIDEADKNREQAGEKTVEHIGGLMDISNHMILDRGRLIGLWEFDAEEGEIVWLTFEKATDAIRSEVERTESFVRDELGDARSFSLDSPQSRKPKLERLRQLQNPRR